MKVNLKVSKEFNIILLFIKAHIRYWEDATVDDVEDTNGDLIPCRNGDDWCPIIAIETGIITNWTKGKTAKIHYKVCDRCGWSLQDDEGNIVLIEEDWYVPSCLCPDDNGYGDYIIMTVDENGKINDWEFDIKNFIDDED